MRLLSLAAILGSLSVAQAQFQAVCDLTSCTITPTGVLTSCSTCSNSTSSVVYTGSNKITAINPSVFDFFVNLTSFALRSQLLQTLPANLFSKTQSLTTVDLTNNIISSLPAGLLADQPMLSSVSMGYNALGSVPDNLFANSGSKLLSPNGLTINLSFNRFMAVPAAALSGLPTLQTLTLTGNPITALNGEFMSGASFPALLTLGLGSTLIPSIPANAFAGLGMLTSLTVTGSMLNSVPVDAFNGLKSLTGLSLAGSQVTQLAPGTFAPVQALVTLDLSDNLLTSLPMGLFSSPAGLPVLSTLRLGNNYIGNLPVGVFTGLPRLNSLDASFNMITGIDVGVFLGLPLLGTLNLGSNQIVSVPLGAFHGLISTVVSITIGTCQSVLLSTLATNTCGILNLYYPAAPTPSIVASVLTLNIASSTLSETSPAVGGVIGGLITMGALLLGLAIFLVVRWRMGKQ